ncbi:MAG: DnaJ domain-containing protein [Polyangiaceae bacterium]|nr:DnaJ domain-containing protein [Polyangiaceae bacterium]
MADGVHKYSTVPQLTPGVNLRQLPIGPEEAFLLSRVDGRSAASDLSIATGIAQERVDALLRRLVTLGAVQYGAETPPPPEHSQPQRGSQASRARESRPSGQPGSQTLDSRPEGSRPEGSQPSQSRPTQRLSYAVVEQVEIAGASLHPAAALYDPSELDVDVELDLPRKRRILDTYYQLDSLTYYQLLGVEPTADKKQIKDAYFETVAVFHPDKYFGKRLDHFKPKLERIFQVLTEAHDTLTRRSRRGEYDAYLDSQRRTRALDRMLSDERARAQQETHARRRIEEHARVLDRVSARPPRIGSSQPPGSQAQGSQPPGSQPLQRRASDPGFAGVRDSEPSVTASARTGGAQGPARAPGAPSQPPATGRGGVQEIVGDNVRRRYEDRLIRARESHIAEYRQAAKEALAAGDPVAAASSLRLAASLVPEDAELRLEYERVQAQAGASLAASYQSQAEYEERAGRFAEAAKSYEKAARGRPGDASLLDHAAKCLIEAGTEPAKALDFARRAVVLGPTRSDFRTTFARALLANQQPAEALAEIQQAALLDPTNDSIQLWLRRIRSET